MDLINKPHDKFFKETLGDKDTAKDFLKNYLPEELLKIIDIGTIEVQKDSYIEKELRETFSDLLFKIKINENEGYIYFLFEHKSYPSKMVTLQLLKYMLRIWEQKVSKEKDEKIPIIIPLVVYHGKARWTIGNKLSELIEGYKKLPGGIKKYIPEYEYILYDISKYSDNEIKGNVKLQIFLKILRDIFENEEEKFMETLRESIEILEKIERQEKGIEYFETFIYYIMNARNDIELKRVYNIVKEISTQGSEMIMTIAEQLIKEGMEKG
ncbi:MAG: Rpn family recombination-promoting nuclease/putative transposase, partial [Eubacteriaceae bacterium]